MAKKRLFNEDYIYADMLAQAEEAKNFLEKSLENDKENISLKAKLNSIYRIRNNAFALMLHQGYEVRGVLAMENDEQKYLLVLDLDGDIYETDALSMKNVLSNTYADVLTEVYNKEKSEYTLETLLSLKKPKQPKKNNNQPKPAVKEEVLVEEVVAPTKPTGNIDIDITDIFSEVASNTSTEKPFYPIPEKKNEKADEILNSLMPQFDNEVKEEPKAQEVKEEETELDITDEVVADIEQLATQQPKKEEDVAVSFFDDFNLTVSNDDIDEEKDVKEAETVLDEKTVEVPKEEPAVEEISFEEIPVENKETVTDIPVAKEEVQTEELQEKTPEISEQNTDNNTQDEVGYDFFSEFGISVVDTENTDDIPVKEEPKKKETVKETPKKVEQSKEETRKVSIADLKKEQNKDIKEEVNKESKEDKEEQPIVKIVAQHTVKDTMCPHCRAIVKENDTICSVCGFDLTNPDITMAEMLEKDEDEHMDEDDIKSILEEIKREYEKAKREEEEAEEKARLEAEKAKKPEFDMSAAPKHYVRDNFKNVKMYRPQESNPDKAKVELLYDVYTIKAIDPKITPEEIEKKLESIKEKRRLTSDQLLRIKEEYENAPRKEREFKVYLFPLHIPENGNERLSQCAAYIVEDGSKIGYFASDFNKPGSLSVVTSTHNFRFLYNWEEGQPKTKFTPGPEKDNITEVRLAQVRPSDISRVGFGHPFITLKVEYIDGYEAIEIHALPIIEEDRTENGNVRCVFICDDKQAQKRDVLHTDKNSEAIKQFNNKDYKMYCVEEGDTISIKVDVLD